MQWVHNACMNIKNEEATILEAASNNVLFICNSCLAILPDALCLSKCLDQLDKTLDTKFKTLYEKLYNENSNCSDQYTAQAEISFILLDSLFRKFCSFIQFDCLAPNGS